MQRRLGVLLEEAKEVGRQAKIHMNRAGIPAIFHPQIPEIIRDGTENTEIDDARAHFGPWWSNIPTRPHIDDMLGFVHLEATNNGD